MTETVAERILLNARGERVTQAVHDNPFMELTGPQLLESKRQSTQVITWFQNALRAVSSSHVDLRLRGVIRQEQVYLDLTEAALAAKGVG